MDKKAKHILFQTYWSAKGWRDKPVTALDDFLYAMGFALLEIVTNCTFTNTNIRKSRRTVYEPCAKVYEWIKKSLL